MDSGEVSKPEERPNIGIRIYSLIAGALYIILGLFQTTYGFGLKLGIDHFLLLPEDGIGGLVLIVIGIVFILGVLRSVKTPQEGKAFAMVGTILGLFFTVIYILIMVADILEALIIVNEDWADWTIIDSIRPGLYLGIVTLIGALIFRKDFLFGGDKR